MILFQKAEFGESFVRAFIRKYFRNEDAEEILEKGDKELIETVLEIQRSIQANQSGETPVETELDDNALVKSNKFYRRIEFMGFSEIWKKIMDVTHLQHLTLFNRGVNSLGTRNEIRALFPNLTQLSLEISLISTWEQVFRLSEQLPNLKLLDLNYNCFYFLSEKTQFLNEFEQVKDPQSRPTAF